MSAPYSYLHIANAKQISGKDRWLLRVLEIIPGFFAWGTLLGMVLASWLWPLGAAIFIILFDLYWLVKTVYLSLHLRGNWKRMRHNLKMNWAERVENLKWDHTWQIVIAPFYKEPLEIVEAFVKSIANSKWPKERMILVLAAEERAGAEAKNIAETIREKYKNVFLHFLITTHPKDLPGELAGKGSNAAWAGEQVKKVVDSLKIPYEDIMLSCFDIDTQVPDQYFYILTYSYLTTETPERTSFQPVPVYNNNIWDAPAFSRVVAMSGTFWQMMQQERPERLATFSSHSMSFKALAEMGFWQRNNVSEDSRIFWNGLLYYKGDYKSEPMSYPVYMDANIGKNFWETVKNVYKQQRRWAWGAENFSYAVFGFLKIPEIPLRKKLFFTMIMLEGLWSWSTNALLMFFLGWLPLALGGEAFNSTVLSYNLPQATRLIMTFAMVGIVTSIVISTSMLPPRPGGIKKHKSLFMILQWLLMPVTLIVFGSVPALDAQTRLMLGKYMSFWVTPKFRSNPEAEKGVGETGVSTLRKAATSVSEER
ncbi:glycosyltransferase family 2 protein [Candidatus Giovannonibacteria bacterium]|nr:glycosyltransferase family 2 protein [Candidatus Giovannonibacteria bacterium]